MLSSKLLLRHEPRGFPSSPLRPVADIGDLPRAVGRAPGADNFFVADHSFRFRSGGNLAMLAAAVGVPFCASKTTVPKSFATILNHRGGEPNN
jgi:hypothetical protein